MRTLNEGEMEAQIAGIVAMPQGARFRIAYKP